jgi:hypothetical protein
MNHVVGQKRLGGAGLPHTNRPDRRDVIAIDNNPDKPRHFTVPFENRPKDRRQVGGASRPSDRQEKQARNEEIGEESIHGRIISRPPSGIKRKPDS